MDYVPVRGHMIAATSALTIHLSDLASAAVGIAGCSKILRREPTDRVSLEIAAEDLRSARRTLDLMSEAVDTAAKAVAAELEPQNVVEFSKAPESFQPVGDAASKAVGRLVPRPIPVKSAGAMGTTSPGGDAA